MPSAEPVVWGLDLMTSAEIKRLHLTDYDTQAPLFL